MFPNQINFRELFSNPGAYISGRNEAYDSQNNSQLPYSQLDFSDSQEQSCSQNSLSNSPGKKFYSRYNKGLTRQNSQENLRNQLPSSVKLTNQQLQTNIARAKDRDERDLLNTMLTTVRESAGEILMAVAVVRDTIQQGGTSSQNHLELYLDKMQKTLTSSNEEMMKALKVNECHRQDQEKLRAELLKKECHVTELEAQLETMHQERNDTLVEKLSMICEKEHQKTQDKIKKLYQDQKKELADCAENYHHDQISELRDTKEQLKKLHKTQSEQMRESNTKLSQKVQNIMQQVKTVHEKLSKDLKETLKNIQKQFKTDTENMLDKQTELTAAVGSDRSHEQMSHICHLLQNYQLDITHKLTEQLEGVVNKQEITLKEAILISLQEDQKQKEIECRQLQDNIEKRIEKEIEDLKKSHKDQLDQIMRKLKLLAPPVTPKVTPAIIPPPTPEQFKQQQRPAGSMTPNQPGGTDFRRNLRSHTRNAEDQPAGLTLYDPSTSTLPSYNTDARKMEPNLTRRSYQSHSYDPSCVPLRNENYAPSLATSGALLTIANNSRIKLSSASLGDQHTKSSPFSMQVYQSPATGNVGDTQSDMYNCKEFTDVAQTALTSNLQEKSSTMTSNRPTTPKKKRKKRRKARITMARSKPKSRVQKNQVQSQKNDDPEFEWESVVRTNTYCNQQPNGAAQKEDGRHNSLEYCYSKNQYNVANTKTGLNTVTASRSDKPVLSSDYMDSMYVPYNSVTMNSQKQTYGRPKYDQILPASKYCFPWSSKTHSGKTSNDMYDFEADEKFNHTMEATWKKPAHLNGNVAVPRQRTATEQDERWQEALGAPIALKSYPQQHSGPKDRCSVVSYNNKPDTCSQLFQDSETTFEDDVTSVSRDSSPCLSVTEVIVKRKFQHETNTPKQNGWAHDGASESLTGGGRRYSGASIQQTFQPNQFPNKRTCTQRQLLDTETDIFTTEVMAIKRSIRHKNGNN